MWDSYKRFVKTWIFFCESMDSYRIVTTNPDSKKVRFVPYDTNPANPGFISYRGSQILTFKDLFRIVSHESSQFSKIRLFLRIQRILRNPQYYSTKQILKNRDLRIRTLKIRIVDSIRRSVFERFVSWIHFVKTKISNYSIRIPHPQ